MCPDVGVEAFCSLGAGIHGVGDDHAAREIAHIPILVSWQADPVSHVISSTSVERQTP
jgi:hypothetical protein